MPYQDTALVCLNGHLINSRSNRESELNTKFCEKCGTENISQCPSCNSIIRGDIHYEDIYEMSDLETPSFCHNCGTPYPWTTEKIKALIEIVEFSNLGEEDKEIFNSNIENIVSDSPRTNLAAFKIKNIGSKLLNGMWDEMLKPLIVDIASETAKKAMGI